MQIFTLDDVEFPELLSAWKGGEVVGQFWQKGKIRVVRACKKFVLISPDNANKKFAVRPTRSLEESMRLAKQFLKREEKRGSKVKLV
jgi:hypothetical protein